MKTIRYRGFSLVELMVSTAILIVAIMPVLILFFNYLAVMDMSKNTTIAVSDASYVLESMRSTDPFTISNVTTGYPAGQDLSAIIGPDKLVNESVTVTYQNPSADPLVITVTVSWQDQVRVRNRSISLVTMMTQR